MMGMPISSRLPGDRRSFVGAGIASSPQVAFANVLAMHEPHEAREGVKPGEALGVQSGDIRRPTCPLGDGRVVPSAERTAMDAIAYAIATAGGCGLVPRAPGTAGAFVALLAFLAVTGGLGFLGVGWTASICVHLGIVCTLSALGVWAAARTECLLGRQDDGRIVIDEVAGQWVALLPVAGLLASHPVSGPFPFDATAVQADGRLFFSAVVTAFVLFRVFDVLKPGWVGWAERRFKGGWGVMLDDLIAGAQAALLLGLALFVFAQEAPSPQRSAPIESGSAQLEGALE